jgi:DNA-binding transcriptional ArsR family regulator
MARPSAYHERSAAGQRRSDVLRYLRSTDSATPYLIALNVGFSQRYVEAALYQLRAQGLVKSEEREYRHIFWSATVIKEN